MKPLTDEQIAAIDARFESGETVWMWCIHHSVLCEPLSEPLSNRIKFINEHKEASERPIRLLALQPTMGPPPEVLVRAHADCNKAHADFDKARADYGKARCDKGRADYGKAWADYRNSLADYGKAWADCAPELLAQLRREYMDHPWDDEQGQINFGDTE